MQEDGHCLGYILVLKDEGGHIGEGYYSCRVQKKENPTVIILNKEVNQNNLQRNQRRREAR